MSVTHECLTSESHNREGWIKSGWSRGVFISLNDNAHLKDIIPAEILSYVEKKESIYLVPVTYDCALVDEDFSREPWAQIILLWKADNENGNFKFGKNPRVIQIPVNIGSNIEHYEAQAIGICHVKRDTLLRSNIDKTRTLSPKFLKIVLGWCAARITRSVFPDSWNNRLSKSKKIFEKIWNDDTFNSLISGVYINAIPFNEQADDKFYDANVILCFDTEQQEVNLRKYKDKFEQQHIEMISGAFKTTLNINLKSVKILADTEFTKSMERDFHLLDLEYFSSKE
ncbi:hypothetical protein ACEUCT_14895 [Aeromonas caviae]|uniref:hypothetical protein n=1 Tax=Aeromonas TaxID=642 RepID=UPI001269953F|nr:hypothetical protein [Aeromonas caviae]